jgi:hypothetical protein
MVTGNGINAFIRYGIFPSSKGPLDDLLLVGILVPLTVVLGPIVLGLKAWERIK